MSLPTTNDEKNVFLKSLEEDQIKSSLSVENGSLPEQKLKEKKKLSGIAVFAAFFAFFLFFIVLLIFVMGMMDPESNPILEAFGVNPVDIKEFLKSLVNKTFMVLSIFLLVVFAIGLFRGFSIPKENQVQKKSSFLFSLVSGGLIFSVLIAWVGSYAFIDRFVVAPDTIHADILITNVGEEEAIIAPIDLHFSAENIAKVIKSRDLSLKGYRWSKNGGSSFTNISLDDKITFAFESKGRKEVVLEVVYENGETERFSIKFDVDDATFLAKPETGPAPLHVEFDATGLTKERGANKFEWDFNGDGFYEESRNSPRINSTFSDIGKKNIGLRVSFYDGSIETFTKEITVMVSNEKPIIAVITIDPTESGVAPYSVKLSGENSNSLHGKIIKYEWSFGDSGREKRTGKQVFRTFNAPGIYNVHLLVVNEFGEEAEDNMEIRVTTPSSIPEAIISTTPKPSSSGIIFGVTPFEVVFDASESIDPDNDIISYEWFLGEDMETPFATGNKITKVFRDPGNYPVNLVITDAEGNTATEKRTVNVKSPTLFSKIVASPENGTVPLIVDFDGSSSYCKVENCKIISFEWNFGDGTPPQVTGAHTSHQFISVGTYEVRLTVTTNDGKVSDATQQIAVNLPPLVACFTTSRSSGPAPLTITFNPSDCSEGDIEKYKWDFGDGIISEKRKPTHTFEKEGDYEVTLLVSDKDNRIDRTTKTITVTSPEDGYYEYTEE